MEQLRKAFRELSIQYLHNDNPPHVKRILRMAIKDVMVEMKTYLPAPTTFNPTSL